MEYKSISELTDSEIRKFKSTSSELDWYFHVFAKKNEEKGISRTFAYYEDGQVKGFATLCNSEVEFRTIPEPERRNLPRYPIPAIKIARLAVDYRHETKGIGSSILKECFLRIINASLISGVYFIVVDAKEESKTFYEKYGFKKLEKTERTYFIDINTILKAYKISLMNGR